MRAVLNTGCALAFALAVGLVNVPRPGRADDKTGTSNVQRTLDHVSAGQGDRLLRALRIASNAKRKDAGVEVQFSWKTTSSDSHGSDWRASGTMSAHYKVTEESSHNPVFGWLSKGKKVEFDFDRSVVVAYDSGAQRLTATIDGEAELLGSYALSTKTTESFDEKLSSLSLSSKNFAVAAAMDKKHLTAQVSGLPYVLTPRLELSTVGAGHPRLELGMLWRSSASLTAVPVAGKASDVSFDLSFANQKVVDHEVGSASRPCQSTVSARCDGDGLLGELAYDETETDLAYRLRLRAYQDWSVQIESFPLVQIQSAHWEKSFPKKWKDGIESITINDDGSQADGLPDTPTPPRPRDPAASAAALAGRFKSLYSVPEPPIGDPDSIGFIRRLTSPGAAPVDSTTR